MPGRIVAEYLLVVLIEQVFHPAEQLHARLQLVGGGRNEPVVVERYAAHWLPGTATNVSSFIVPL